MRLITHNFLQCPRTKTYPLTLVPMELETVSTEYNGQFLEHVLKRINWNVLRETSQQLDLGSLPEIAPEKEDAAPEVFRLLHSILLETHVKSGTLVSTDGSTYPISNYIPNMMTTVPKQATPGCGSGSAAAVATGDAEMSAASAATPGGEEDHGEAQPMES